MSSQIWTPDAPKKQNAQISGNERVCVLIHAKTKRILCFALDDLFAKSLEDQGYEKIALFHAHEYDKYAKMWREQSVVENDKEEYERLIREDVVRQKLRGELRDRMIHAQPHERHAIESSLRVLDHLQKRKQRLHETFLVQEAYESSRQDVGETIARKIIENA